MTLCEPLVNLTLVAELFPHRHPVTVARWNRGDTSTARGKRLPAPDLVVGGVELWKVESVLSWANGNGERVNPSVLDRILRDQTS